MKELSAASQSQPATAADPVEEAARQRRSAERDGRRRLGGLAASAGGHRVDDRVHGRKNENGCVFLGGGGPPGFGTKRIP